MTGDGAGIRERIAALAEQSWELSARDARRGLALGEQALALALELGDDELVATSLLGIGRNRLKLAEYTESEEPLSRALAWYDRSGDQRGRTRALSSLALLDALRGRSADALTRFHEALAAARASGSVREEAGVLNNLGNLYLNCGDFASATEQYLEALPLYRQFGNDGGEAHVLNNLAGVYGEQGRHEEAVRFRQEAHDLATRTGNAATALNALAGLADQQLALGRTGEARRSGARAAETARALGNPAMLAYALTVLARVELRATDPAAALIHAREALAVLEARTDAQVRVNALGVLGEALLSLGDPDGARSALGEMLDVACAARLAREEGTAHALLTRLHEQLGDDRAALRHHRHFHSLERRLHGEQQDLLTQRLLVRHEVEKTREVAEVQRALNDDLRRANEELAAACRHNQDLLERVRHQAQHDALTGLPNRALFEDRLGQALADAGRHGDVLAVMFLDLDGFKRVNDTMGHDVGDDLLVAVAGRLRTTLRAGDTVARLGGDEFTVVARELRTPDDAALVAEKLLAALTAPLELRGRTVTVGASLGVSLFPRDGRDAVTLQRHADVAMYAAKNGGRGRVRFFEPERTADEDVREQTRRRRDAVPDRALEVVFEDRFDVRSGEVTGFGTRLRPTDPATRPGPPRHAEFETAGSEDSALAVHLDTWAVEAACEEAARRRVAWPTLVAGVDVSPLSFTRPDFPEMIVDTLARHGLPGAALEIAVHERLARQDPVGLSVRAEALRAAGVRIALSGMGAPDAALAALPGLPLDALRVGEELTRHRTEEQARTFVAALVGFADALGLTVVAQGARDGTAPAAGPVEGRGEWPGVSPRPASPGAHT